MGTGSGVDAPFLTGRRPPSGHAGNRMRISIRSVLAVCLLAARAAVAAENAVGPVPPCDGAESWPRFSRIAGEPATMLWHADDLKRTVWTPPSCTGWSSVSPSSLVAALAGEFAFKGSAETLLARIGSVSSLRNLLYWSTAEGNWRPMARDAAALAGSDPQGRRPDFSATEFAKGNLLYYWMDDDQTGSVVYRMWVLERSDNRIVIASENASRVRFLFFTLFQPGEIQAVEFLERSGPDLWRVYLLTRIPQRARLLAWQQETSSVNRLVALYRQLAGLPADGAATALP